MHAVNLSILEYLTVGDGNSLLFVEPLLNRRKLIVIRHIRRRRTPTREPVRTSAGEFFLLSGPGAGDLRAGPTAVGKEQTGFERAVPRAVPVAVLYCCTASPAVRIMVLTSGAKGTRTPDPLLAKQARSRGQRA